VVLETEAGCRWSLRTLTMFTFSAGGVTDSDSLSSLLPSRLAAPGADESFLFISLLPGLDSAFLADSAASGLIPST
jgi:hypothetical protein